MICLKNPVSRLSELRRYIGLLHWLQIIRLCMKHFAKIDNVYFYKITYTNLKHFKDGRCSDLKIILVSSFTIDW